MKSWQTPWPPTSRSNGSGPFHRTDPPCLDSPPAPGAGQRIHRQSASVGDVLVLHQRNLRLNWTWREVVDVLVITPAVGETPEGVKTTALGRLKFARLRRLNISARN